MVTYGQNVITYVHISGADQLSLSNTNGFLQLIFTLLFGRCSASSHPVFAQAFINFIGFFTLILIVKIFKN